MNYIDHLYGVIIFCAILLSAYIFKRLSKNIINVDIYEGLLFVVIPAILLARVWHVFTDFELYRNNILEVFDITNGGLSIWGALVGGCLGVIIFVRKSKINLNLALNYVAVAVPVGQAVGRLGNWANQELFGPPTNAFWGIYIKPDHRPQQFSQNTHFHPAFLYEIIGNMLLFAVLLVLLKQIEKHKPQILKETKTLVFVYLLGYSIVRFMVEFYRIEDDFALGLSFNQVLALLIAVFSIIALWKNTKHYS